MSDLVQESERENVWGLVPLTPEYLPDEHGGYVDAIEAALDDELVLNIALSGNYGVGKSSILREVARRQDGRVVELSLSTLAPVEASDLDDSVPKQATTPTNRIQQEIVKQLLYRVEPGKTPGSRFERIERFSWKRELAVAGLVGFAGAVVFLLTTWSAQIATVFKPLIDLGLWIHLIILLLAVLAALGVRRLFYGRVHIKQFTAGSATVTLDDKSVSYFDQYLDEIVHFFEVSKKEDIVIFEDIDRFNNSHIFETLRSLNTLLNGAPQIKKKIRFIYAIKDSIFDRIGLEDQGRKLDQSIIEADDPAQAETIRANRTKFFDLVIPVVPFITHRSARNLVSQLLGKLDHTVKPELLDLAAQYVPDMRLLKNVRNEFIVFRDRIFSGDGAQLDLSQTDLFAMMLYKSTHLTDFEGIRIGKSKLDALYDLQRKLVAENIQRIERERRVNLQALVRLNSAATRSARLGDLLLAHMQRTAISASVLGSQRQNAVTYSGDGASKSDADLRSAEFWTEFVSADGDPVLRLQMTSGHPLSFSRSSLAAALRDPLDMENWNEADRTAINEEIAEKSEAINFLRGADMGALIQRPEFHVKHEDEAQSLDAIARDLLTPGLAFQLVRAGFINRNFTQYTSTFHGDRVSTAATNFIIHHVERDSMDEHFELTPADVDMVVRERGKQVLKESALYNIAILDHLLDSDVEAADIMIRSFISFGESQMTFLQAFLSSGSQRRSLVERLTAMSPRVLKYLVNEAELDDASLLDLADAALENLAAGTKYLTDENVAVFLRENYADIRAMAAVETSRSQAARIAVLFDAAGIKLPLLSPLAINVQRQFIERSLYEIVRENLQAAVGVGEGLALDSIGAADQTIYGYCLDNLEAYLSAIDEAVPTVAAADRFVGVIEDVLARTDGAHLGEVVGGSAEACIIDDLGKVSTDAWEILAEHERFPATFENTTRYIESVGALDTKLAKLLTSAGSVSGIDAAEEAAKEALAKTILTAKAVLPSAGLRARLVVSLDLDDYLDVDEIPAETGELFALLRSHDLIADDATSYERLAGTDWPTREAFIHESKKFKDFVTPAHVQNDLAALFQSEKVDTAIKAMIVERADEFAEGLGASGLSQLARFATQNKRQVSEDVVYKMALGSVPAQYIVLLLEPHLVSIARERLFMILQSLGGDYPKLTSVGHDKPRIPNTAADRVLLDCMKLHGTVNSYDSHASPIKVNKKHK
ncbi:DNA-binding protein [Arthrobacter sp. NPDC058192]|uniref:YobI family P-loop NTPase n=1 Tax=Arthrobacter sp. NPDC058192 TaxID=3346372 RepID=UPI0036E26ACE